MTLRTIQDVLEVMNDMVALEVALADLYQACSDQFPEDRSFWLAIRHQEQLHAKFIGQLADLVSAHPQEFKFGRPFNSTAIKTTLASVANYTESVKKGLLQRKRALFMARDIENSVLEAKYGDIVSTDNVEFNKTIELIARDTLAHKNVFAAKVEKTKG
jgi:hypothetical protein